MAQSFLQSRRWSELKEQSLWHRHVAEGVMGLSKQLPLGVKFIYFPEVTVPSNKLKKFVTEVARLCRRAGFAFARIEFFEEFRGDTNLKKLGLKKSPEEMQPEYRQVIDLRPPIHEILAAMKPKGRYNVRLAERKGVIVKPSDDLKTFYALYAETTQRDGFTRRPRQYFDDLMATMGTTHAQLYLAWLGKRPLAGGIIVFWQGRASYLYGGSSSALRNVMAPSLLHFKIMEDAKTRGMKVYDMLAIAPADALYHKYAGLRRFKEQFGGQSVRLLGSYDLIFDPLRYTLFTFGEKLRGRW